MSKDYIERGALLGWLDAVDGIVADGTVEAPTLYKQVITDIKQFPAADVVEVKHAKWGELIYDAYTDEFRRPCSNCGSHSIDYRNYCPNCGAKMDGGADNG